MANANAVCAFPAFFSFSPHRPENFCIFLIPFRIFVFCRQWTFILAHHMQVSLFSLKPPTQALFPASLTRTLHRSSIPRVEIGGCTGPSVWGVCQVWTDPPGRSPAPPPKGLFFFFKRFAPKLLSNFANFFYQKISQDGILGPFLGVFFPGPALHAVRKCPILATPVFRAPR